MGSSRTTLDDAAVAVGRLLAAESALSRTELSRCVCRTLGWRATNGRLWEMSCRVTLNRLERDGRITLPPSRDSIPEPRHRRRGRVGEILPQTVFGPLAELGRLKLVRVTAADAVLSAKWQELTARHHYLGSGTRCGRQLRYLIRSEHCGIVGTLAFTSAALHLAAREASHGSPLGLVDIQCWARDPEEFGLS